MYTYREINLMNMEIFEAWQIWLAIGIGLLALEAIVPGFVLGSFAIGALVTIVPAALGLSMSIQIIIFSIASVISFLLLRPFVMKYLDKGEVVKLNADGLVGQRGVVSIAFDHQLKKGRVRVAGDDWVALNLGNEELSINDVIVVEKVDSITLEVRKFINIENN